MKKCQKVRKSAKNYETILPFSCCPLVFPWLSLGRVRVCPWDDCPTRAVRKTFMCFVFIGGQKSMQTFFLQSFSRTLRVMDVRAKKSWTSAPRNAFFCGQGDGEKLFDPGASGRKGQECPRKIGPKSLCLCCFFFPEFIGFFRRQMLLHENHGNHGTTRLSDFSNRLWRDVPPTWVIHMATSRPAHNTPIHMDLGPFLVILRACHRAQKLPNPEVQKKRNPQPQVGPRKYKKKIPKKYKNGPKTAILGPFLYIFQYFFHIFGGQPALLAPSQALCELFQQFALRVFRGYLFGPEQLLWFFCVFLTPPTPPPEKKKKPLKLIQIRCLRNGGFYEIV